MLRKSIIIILFLMFIFNFNAIAADSADSLKTKKVFETVQNLFTDIENITKSFDLLPYTNEKGITLCETIDYIIQGYSLKGIIVIDRPALVGLFNRRTIDGNIIYFVEVTISFITVDDISVAYFSSVIISKTFYITIDDGKEKI